MGLLCNYAYIHLDVKLLIVSYVVLASRSIWTHRAWSYDTRKKLRWWDLSHAHPKTHVKNRLVTKNKVKKYPLYQSARSLFFVLNWIYFFFFATKVMRGFLLYKLLHPKLFSPSCHNGPFFWILMCWFIN